MTLYETLVSYTRCPICDTFLRSDKSWRIILECHGTFGKACPVLFRKMKNVMTISTDHYSVWMYPEKLFIMPLAVKDAQYTEFDRNALLFQDIQLSSVLKSKIDLLFTFQ